MSAVPALMAVTVPSSATVATSALLVDHVTFLLVAFSGRTVATSFLVSLTLRAAVFVSRDTLLTDTLSASSVTGLVS